MLVPVQDIVGQFLSTFEEYPPRMQAASFSLDKVLEQLSTPVSH
jgi:arylsulfatase